MSEEKRDIVAGYDLGDTVNLPAVVIVERLPGGGMRVLEQHVGDAARDWIRANVPREKRS